MTKRKAFHVSWSAALLALALIGTACSNSDDGNAPSSVDSTASSSPIASPAESPSESPSSDPANAEAPVEQDAAGTYVGLADGHSVEIETGSGSVTYQIGPEIADQVSSWEEGTPVKYKFVEEDLEVDGQTVKQTTIVSIEKE